MSTSSSSLDQLRAWHDQVVTEVVERGAHLLSKPELLIRLEDMGAEPSKRMVLDVVEALRDVYLGWPMDSSQLWSLDLIGKTVIRGNLQFKSVVQSRDEWMAYRRSIKQYLYAESARRAASCGGVGVYPSERDISIEAFEHVMAPVGMWRMWSDSPNEENLEEGEAMDGSVEPWPETDLTSPQEESRPEIGLTFPQEESIGEMLDREMVRTIVLQTGCSHDEAGAALARHNGDLVDALLSMVPGN